ncbi:immunoglobulin-like domain-containing protein (plasmid) [Haladaptatus sp. SPP-AMP-3]|uniref:immunoglobulin-like domain-containing protein n=1 Tax=Haladaptatus sp. SPP-AMP-3 TaxID=3121295 RepID=UPI003C2AAE31
MDRQWSRRALLHLCGAAAASLGGCTALGRSKNAQPLTEQYEETLEFEEPITYEHDQLQLSGPEKPVTLGETIEFTVTNTGTSEVSLGCQNPWTLQQRNDGRWREVIWTTSDAFLLCLTVLKPGDSLTEDVTLRRSALETQSEIVKYDLTPGLYRLVLLETDPYFAVNFRIKSSK